MGLITLVGLITIGLSTYMILYSHPLYEFLAPALRVFERRSPHRETNDESDAPEGADAIVVGMGRYGLNIAKELRSRGWSVLGVDFDPHAVRNATAQGINAHYADAEDPEELGELPFASARWVVGTTPLHATERSILESLRENGYKGMVAATAHRAEEASALERAGVTMTLFPYADGAVRAAERIDSHEPGRRSAPVVTRPDAAPRADA